MASLLLSSPNLSSPFLGKKHCVRGNTEKLGLLKIHRTPKCAALDASYGGNVSKFPRISVWNPYKRLGITPDASEEEIWSSRNFLLQQYAGHERSEESIEAAFERILMDSYWKRKKTKINLKSRLKKQVEESPLWVKNLLNFVELPPTEVIFRRLFLFAFMAGWSIMNSAEGGPAFQTWIPCDWVGMWFCLGSHDSGDFTTTYVDTRTPYITSSICFLVPWLYFSQVKPE